MCTNALLLNRLSIIFSYDQQSIPAVVAAQAAGKVELKVSIKPPLALCESGSRRKAKLRADPGFDN